MKKLLFLLLLIPSICFAGYSGSHEAGWTSTADDTSIEACLDDAGFVAGDTITVTGNATYDDGTQLLIDESVNLIGSGTPIITRGTSTAALVRVAPSTDVTIRISGFQFNGGTNNNTTKVSIDIIGIAAGLTNVRIDHNTFNKGKRVVQPYGYAYPLIDNNAFINCDIAVGPIGDSDSWNRTIAAGTANAVYIENNTFTANDDSDQGLNQQIYHQGGARSVTRYNTFDFTAVTAYVSGGFYDSHGNQGGCDNLTSTFRGQPILEVYNNVFRLSNKNRFNGPMMYIRGGSTIIYNNDFYTATGTPDYPNAICLTEEETWASGSAFDPCAQPMVSAWPATDQIYNSFFYNNRSFWDGAAGGTTFTAINLRDAVTDPAYIVENQEYFMAAPAASGGKATLGSVPGIANNTCTGSGTPYACCTGDGTGTCDMTFSGVGANAYYQYTRYTCPHPDAGSGSCDSGTAGRDGYRFGNTTLGSGPAFTFTGPAFTLN